MQFGSVRRACRVPQLRLSRRILAVAAVAFGVSGCASQPSFKLASLTLPASTPSTITFESIDGPPPEVFRKLVASLDDEAKARKIAVVARAQPATYRVRGYVSALVERDKTTFAWVWDVYDTDKRRAVRVAGEELAAPGKRRDAWTAADEALVRRMASSGMERIAAFLSNPNEAPPAVAPEAPGITLASARDDSPEAAGIFRLFRAAEPPPVTTGSAVAEPAPPPPPKRAKPARRPAATSAALDAAQ